MTTHPDTCRHPNPNGKDCDRPAGATATTKFESIPGVNAGSSEVKQRYCADHARAARSINTAIEFDDDRCDQLLVDVEGLSCYCTQVAGHAGMHTWPA